MPSKFNSYTNPNILVLNAKRTKQRNERNFSLKIEKLHVFTKSSEQNYSLLSDKSLVNEGSSFTITLNTENVANETNVPYTISGIQPGDIGGVSLTGGSFTVNNNTATATFNVTEDFTVEGNETFTLTLDKIGVSVSVTIEDTSTPTFELESSTSLVNEGDSFTITLNTQGVDNDTTVPYTIEGVEPADIDGEPLTGNFTINHYHISSSDASGNAQKTFTVTEDALTEGAETFRLSLVGVDEYVAVNIVDTSRTPSYNLSVDNTTVNETNNKTFNVTLQTQNVNDGERVYYTMSGSGITVNDFIGLTSLKGYFEVGATDTITFTVKEDFITEGDETILFSLDNNNDSVSITIEDTSTPTYDLTSSTSSVNEGDNFTITLNTQGLSNGTVVPYSIEGVEPADIDGEPLTGNFTIDASGNAQVTFNVTEDRLSDGDETFRLLLVGINEYVDVNINDTSKTPGFILQSNNTVDETVPNNVVTITLITENTIQGEQFGYTISGGNITLDDFIGRDSLTGTFTLDANGQDTLTLTINEDFITENNETLILALDNGKAQKSIIINDTSIETYDLASNQNTVNEGENIIITLTTRGVVDGTSIPYTITGVSSNDIGGVNTTGNFIVNNNIATATFNVTEDFSSIEPGFIEGIETFILTLDDIGESVSVDINDTSVQTFELTSSTSSVNEGGNFTITLNTQGVFNGVAVPYTITGINANDITESLTGNFTINNNTATKTFNVTEDFTTDEGAEIFTLTLNNNADSIDVTINDTSVQTFNLSSSTTSVNEGSNFTITLNTQGVSNGTNVPYTISGNVTSTDIDDVSLTGGSFTVGADGTATATFNVTADQLTEGNETFTLSLDNNADSIDVTINDTSNSPEDQALSVLFLGTVEPFSVRSQDIEELFTNSQYTSDPTALDTKLDSDNYDVVALNNVDWSDDGILFPNLTTYNKLKDFVTRGGVVMHWGEHWDKFYYVNEPTGSGNGSGTVANIAYDLGGIIGTNSEWKSRTSTIQGNSYPTQIALDYDVINSPSHPTTYAEYVINSRSKGMPILDAKGNTTLSIVHMWDGNITGHLNSGITGKIIMFGDASGLTYSQNVNNLNNNMIYPIFDYIARTKTINWKQLGQDIDGEAALDESGSSVSINAAGNRVAIGAIRNDGNGNASGHTRIYEYSNNTWTQLGQDIDGEDAFDNSGYSVSMNDTGNRIAIGAIRNDDNGTDSGHTRIYEYSNNTWTQLGQDIDGEDAFDNSGNSVSMNAAGDRVAIGAYLNDGGDGGDGSDNRIGHTRIYEYSNDTWTQLGQDIDGEDAFDYISWSVSMNAAGDRVVIGATNTGDDGGHTRIYEYNGTNWVQLGQDIDGEAAMDDSGYSVSMNDTGNRIAIGARYNDGNGNASGHTRIYEFSNDTWTQLGQDIDGEDAFDNSGYSVSMNDTGNRIAIGAIRNDDNGTDSGHTRIYEYSNNTWTQLGQDIDGEASGDNSGSRVSINAVGDRVAIGAPFNNNNNGIDSGRTRIYWF